MRNPSANKHTMPPSSFSLFSVPHSLSIPRPSFSIKFGRPSRRRSAAVVTSALVASLASSDLIAAVRGRQQRRRQGLGRAATHRGLFLEGKNIVKVPGVQDVMTE
ncbi:hypothetical protein AAHA92_22144 [Salvia divinorum]|uniref:Uncharacterized protein n=1 Tax=Salvia divinorum TaxID=28513 RepID=A0ABD1GMQ0_SALDI